MTPAEASARIAALRAEIAAHDERYYREARPLIADFDYDRLKRELAEPFRGKDACEREPHGAARFVLPAEQRFDRNLGRTL